MKTTAATRPALWKLVLILSFMFGCNHMHSQVRWDGEASDGLWNSALNWVGNAIPSAGDDVILDNSIIPGNYMVTMPSGSLSVSVRTLVILPSVGNAIEALLPPGNTAIPGFIATGAVYGLQIYNGGIFRNSSGASAGAAVDISDSIKIHNGGLYKHNTSRAHANNVMVLSRANGTELGSFEFDVPGGSGYTISIAGRVYGTMILSAIAAGGAKSYTSTGTTPVQVNGEFRINPGASYSLNFNGSFNVLGDLIHQGNVFDISSGMHSNLVIAKKNFVHTGIITESGTGTPVIEFGGNSTQNISSAGNLTGNFVVRINNAAGIMLLSGLQIPHHLQFVSGQLKTTASNLLILPDNATCAGGSLNSFVEGPVRKIGDDDFEFPTGRQGEYAPIRISGAGNATDAFEAEYLLGNPSTTFGTALEDPPIVRLSSLEYWRLDRVSGTSQKTVTLSVRTYSDATLLEKLVVSRWDASSGIWRNEGNTAFSGIASGTITSQPVNSFRVFTVASTVLTQNPLPSSVISFTVSYKNSVALLKWNVDSKFEAASFEILKSTDTNKLKKIVPIDAQPQKSNYSFSDYSLSEGMHYFQIRIIEKNGKVRHSPIRSLLVPGTKIATAISCPGIVRGGIDIFFQASQNDRIELHLFNVEGKLIEKFSTTAVRGGNKFVISRATLAPGFYYIFGILGRTKTNTVKLIKL